MTREMSQSLPSGLLVLALQGANLGMPSSINRLT